MFYLEPNRIHVILNVMEEHKKLPQENNKKGFQWCSSPPPHPQYILNLLSLGFFVICNVGDHHEVKSTFWQKKEVFRIVLSEVLSELSVKFTVGKQEEM